MSFLRMKKAAAKKKRSFIKPLVAPSCVAVILILILYWSVSAKLAGISAELDNKTKELASLNPLRDATQTLIAKKGKLQAEMESYPLSLLKEGMDPARILEDLRLCAPDNIRLEQIYVFEQAGKRFVQVSGTAFFLDERGPAMSVFMAALKDSLLFDDVRMDSVEEEESYTIDGLRFRFSCQYNYNNYKGDYL